MLVSAWFRQTEGRRSQSPLLLLFLQCRTDGPERRNKSKCTENSQDSGRCRSAPSTSPTSSHAVAHSLQVLLAGGNPQLIPAHGPASALPTFGQRRYGSRLMDHIFNCCWDGVVMCELQRLRGQTRLSAVSPRQVNAPLQHRHPQSPPIGPPTAKQIQTQGISDVLLLADGHVWLLYGLLSGPAGPSFNDIVPRLGLPL